MFKKFLSVSLLVLGGLVLNFGLAGTILMFSTLVGSPLPPTIWTLSLVSVVFLAPLGILVLLLGVWLWGWGRRRKVIGMVLIVIGATYAFLFVQHMRMKSYWEPKDTVVPDPIIPGVIFLLLGVSVVVGGILLVRRQVMIDRSGPSSAFRER